MFNFESFPFYYVPSLLNSSCNSQKQPPEVFCKKGVLRNFAKFAGKHLYRGLFLNKVAGLRPATLLKREILAHVFSCKFCENYKNTFSYKTPPVAASESIQTSCLHNVETPSLLYQIKKLFLTFLNLDI